MPVGIKEKAELVKQCLNGNCGINEAGASHDKRRTTRDCKESTVCS